MAKRQTPTPEIQYVAPPPIKWYGVSGDQLDRIKEACSHVGYDFSFALSSLSIGVTLLGTFYSLPQLTDLQRAIFISLMVLCAVVFVYTGIRWCFSRNKAASIIDAIRRSDQPESQ